jgi:hypothetical protein
VSARQRHAAPGQHEHDCDAERGLPEPLPRDERLVWQGSPDWRTLARRAFHVRKLALYFGALLALRAAFVLSGGGSVREAIVAVLWLTPLAAAGLGIVLTLAWLSSRTTVYTLTDKRVVMRIGIVLTVAFNVPLARIASAAVRLEKDGVGDIPLVLAGSDRIAYLHLWPHARPWRLARPEPMLRSVPNAAEVARLFGEAWSRATGTALATSVSRPPSIAVAPTDVDGSQPAHGLPVMAAHY